MLVVLGSMWGCAREAVPEYPPLAQHERRAASGEAPVRLLHVQYEYVFDDKGNWQSQFKQSYRILNREGVEEWGHLGASWSPWYMSRPELRAEVRDPEGKLRTLDPKTIAESSAYPDVPDIYSDRRQLRAPLPGVQVGSVVSESTVVRTTRPFFPGGAMFQVAFQTVIPHDKVELIIDLPESLPFQYELYDLKVTREETVKNGRRRVVFVGQNLPGVEPAGRYAPSNVATWPSVAFSTGRAWQDIAAAYERVLDEKLKGAAGVAELARRSVRADASPIEQSNQLLYALQQRVRYAAIEFGQAAIIPTTPAETFQRTYGDCKDQSLALVAMLRAVGLPAKLALLRTGPGEDVHPRLPALDVFDHAIVFVETDKPFWIDPTSPFARAGELPESDQGRYALIIDDDSVGLVPTPVMSSSQNQYLETREVRLDDEGNARIRETSSGTGVIEQGLRASYAPSEEERNQGFTAYVKSFYSGDKLLNAKVEGFDDTRRQLKVTLDASTKAFGVDLSEASVPVDLGQLYNWLPGPLLEEQEEGDERELRQGELVLPLLYQAEIRYRVAPAPHFKPKQLPETPPVELGPGRFSRQYRVVEGGVVEATFKFEINKRQLTPADQAALRAGFAQLNAEDADYIAFEHEAEHAFATGQPAQGMRLLRDQAASASTSAIPLTRLSLKLNELGFGRLAREKGRAAVALDPKSAWAQRSLGFVLARDDHNRWGNPGWDREGALMAFQRAAELDPTDTWAKVERALLLEYDAQGRRYADLQSVEQAIKAYDAISDEDLKAYDNGDYRWHALHALLAAGRHDELRRRLEKLKATAEVPAFFGIALAAIEGGAAAGIAQADRRGLRGEARGEALANAASALYSKRVYPAASGLFEEAAKTAGEHATKYATLATTLRAVTRIELEQLKHDTPEALVRKLHVMMLSSEGGLGNQASSNALLPFVSSRFDKDDAFWRLGLDSVGALLFQMRDVQVPRAVLADTGAGLFKASAEGSDAIGYRVTVGVQGIDSFSRSSAFYIVKEGSKYLLRAADDAALGCEALYQLGKQNLKAARQWLAWAAAGERYDSSDDPLGSKPFMRLWADGKGKPELAAAALCAGSPAGAEARQTLLKRRGAPGEEGLAIEQVLADTLERDKRYEQQLAAAEKLLAAHPGSRKARQLKLDALESLKRYDAFERLARQALAEEKGDSFRKTSALMRLAEVLSKAGKFAEARRTFQQVIDDGQSYDRTRALSEAAWLSLFIEPRPPNALELAQQGAQHDRIGRHDSLLTLACLQIDHGKLGEAQRTFERLIENDKTPKLREGTRFVLGALAEAYGLFDEARSWYQSVEAPYDGRPASVHALAQRRLKALDKPAPAKKR
jgi:tetratricopeptide (TPR) repeat protein